jgi:PAS domain S-box-containing protein
MEPSSSDNHPKILLVEDSAVEAEVLRRVLVKAGYQVVLAKDGGQGLQVLREQACALVISDIQMPLMDGYELCEQIKHDEGLWNIPVILVSALAESEDIIRALNVGVDGYLTKPCAENILLGRIHALLAVPQHRSRPDERRVEQIELNGRHHSIAADSRQLLNLLLSLYENTLSQNQELIAAQAQLNRFNNFLEDQVQARTAALRESEARYRRITEGLTDYLYSVRIEGGQAAETTQSPACVVVTGYKPGDFVANPNLWIQMVAPEDRERVMEHARQIMAGEDVPTIEHRIIRKDGETRWVSDTTILLKDASGRLVSYDGVIKDISERKQAESALNHVNRALVAISLVNRQLVYAREENELLQAICQAVVERGGYRMAWVGYAQQDADKTVKIMAHAGHDDGYLDNIHVTWAESERGMGPTGRVIRSGTMQLCQDFADDPRHLPWRDAARKNGYAASIALPLADAAGEVFGALTVYAAEVNTFTPAEVNLLEEMAGDLAFGVRTLHTRHERDLAQKQSQLYLSQLQDSLTGTVRAIASIVEMRDPYTSGHQVRVADLAAAIARQMGLPEDRVQGIHLASIVHDLGKIKIPAEILSKPGLLSDIEYQLIKTHAQAGYDILKDISFPWPIAQMALQHHERVDGTGYPQGLKGEAFMLEARILSVADVVEAMSSHRPYRPALGTAEAMAEIIKHRGTYFDPQVVDACLILFEEKGFAFKT